MSTKEQRDNLQQLLQGSPMMTVFKAIHRSRGMVTLLHDVASKPPESARSLYGINDSAIDRCISAIVDSGLIAEED